MNFGVDLEYIGKNAIKNRGKEELQKVLNKVFDRKDQPQGEPGTESPKRPEQQMIEGILNTIFK